MTYFKNHVFFCVNQREAGESCCANLGAQAVRDYAKKRMKELGLRIGFGLSSNSEAAENIDAVKKGRSSSVTLYFGRIFIY